MSGKTIRLIVGASLDRDALTVFQPLQAQAARARKAIDAETKAAGGAVKTNIRKGVDPAEKAFKDLEKWAHGAQRDIDRETKSAASALAKNIAKGTKDAAREFEKMASDSEKASKRMIRAADMSERRRGRDLAHQQRESAAAMRGGIAGAQRLGGMGLSAARTAVGFGARVAGDIARGAGADLDLASQAGKASNLQTKITDITNSGYMAGQAGPNGQRQDAGALTKELSKAASETGFAVNDAAEGLQKFVSKTGDLETGRAVFKDLAVLSRATGTNLEDMVDAAGDVSNQLGDIPNKAEVINKVMRQIAGEGKLGAVEISDLAKQMAKVAAAASQFEGGHAEAIGTLGMLAQEARAKGGAASASQAATATMSFANTFSKNARSKEFAAHGVKIDGANGAIRDPREIIIDALKATGGNKIEMGKMFMDAGARKVTRGFENIYNDAGGGDKGIEAVRAEFKRLGDVAIQQEEITESFNRSMKTAEAQANAFNNQLETSAGSLRDALTPAAIAAAPALLSLAQGAADFVAFVTGSKPKENAKNAANAGVNVENDIVTTNKMIASGEITPEQIAKSKADRIAAGESSVATSSDLAAAKGDDLYSGKGKAALKVVDGLIALSGGALGQMITGHGWTPGQDAIKGHEAEVAQKQGVADAAKAEYEKAVALNDRVFNLMASGGLKVTVVAQPPPPIQSPPQSSGNTPAGGEK